MKSSRKLFDAVKLLFFSSSFVSTKDTDEGLDTLAVEELSVLEMD